MVTSVVPIISKPDFQEWRELWLTVPHTRTLLGSWNFTVANLRLWNLLPRSLHTVSSFRPLLMTISCNLPIHHSQTTGSLTVGISTGLSNSLRFLTTAWLDIYHQLTPGASWKQSQKSLEQIRETLALPNSSISAITHAAASRCLKIAILRPWSTESSRFFESFASTWAAWSMFLRYSVLSTAVALYSFASRIFWTSWPMSEARTVRAIMIWQTQQIMH